MEKKYYIWILIIFLNSCTERKITPLIIAYKNDSITGVTYRVKSDKIQEWKYSLEENYEKSRSKYQEFVVSKQFIDSLKSLLKPELEFNTGRIFDVQNSEFIMILGDSISGKNIIKVSDSSFIERSYRILTLIKGQKNTIIAPPPKTRNDSLIQTLNLFECEPIRMANR